MKERYNEHTNKAFHTESKRDVNFRVLKCTDTSRQ